MIQVFTRLLKDATNTASYTKKQSKTDMEFIFFEDKGVGKIHLITCMANNLISKCVPVMFTNLFEISKAVLLKKQLTEYLK